MQEHGASYLYKVKQMTVSTHKATAKGSGGVDDGKDSGTILHGGNVAGSRFQGKTLVSIVQGIKLSGSKVIANTGTAHEAGITTANSSGTFAYNPNSPAVTRSSTDTGFLIRGGSPTLIGGRAATGDILAIAGSDFARKSIHMTEGRYKRGTWATSIFNLFRNPTAASTNNHGLLQSDGTAKAGITGVGSHQPHNAIDNSKDVDQAARRTLAVPGEFIFLVDFATQPWTSGGNFNDYSAITG